MTGEAGRLEFGENVEALATGSIMNAGEVRRAGASERLTQLLALPLTTTPFPLSTVLLTVCQFKNRVRYPCSLTSLFSVGMHVVSNQSHCHSPSSATPSH